MWKIEAVKNKYYLCMQILLISYARMMNRRFEMMFSESWGFHFNKSASSLGEAIEPGYRECRYENLQHFHGIRCTEYDKMNINGLTDLCNNYLKKSPIIIAADTFDCPWSDSYKKYHINHYFFITDFIGETVKCFDPYLSDEIKTLSFSALNNWCGKAYTLSCVDYSPEKKDYFIELKKCIEYVKESDFFANLAMFINALESLENLKNEVGKTIDYFSVPLYYNLKHIANNRKCFADFLDYINIYTNIFLDAEISDCFRDIGAAYDMLWVYLMKLTMADKLNKVKLKEKLNSLYEKELNVYKKLSARLERSCI